MPTHWQVPLIRGLLISLLCSGLAYAQPGFNWAIREGSIGADQGYGIKTDAAGNSYTTGKFSGTNVDFDPGPGTALLTSFGTDDIFILKLDPNGNFAWVKQMGGSGSDVPSSLALDPAGNIYITGSYAAAGDFDPGAGVVTLTPNNGPGFNDMFVASIDASGNFRWAVGIGGAQSDAGTAIAASATRVYVTGTYRMTVDFDPGAGVANHSSLAGANDVFVVTFDTNGAYQWSASMGGNNFDRGDAIDFDPSGNVYTSGVYAGPADFDPGASTFNLTTSGPGVQDAFISKLDANGNFVWAKGINGIGWVEGFGLDYAAATDVVHVGGYFNYTADFDLDPLATNPLYNITSTGDTDAFILTIDPSGNLVWLKTFGGTLAEQITSLTTDAAGTIYTTGYFYATADFDPGPGVANLTSAGITETFVSKLDASGNYLWAGRMGGTNADVGYAIDVDPTRNILVTGVFNGTADYDPGPAVFNLVSTSSTFDAFVLKLNPFYKPTITSFFPASGPAGTLVTITGTKFDPTAANNIVYFGATRAVVTVATFTQLSVIVPDGATYQPISVTVNGGTAFSIQPFLVTFPGGGTITSCSFDSPVGFNSGDFGYGVAIGDLDGDGKADIAITKTPNLVQVFRNTSSVGAIDASSFASSVDLTVGTSPEGVVFADIDGDGKLDILATSSGSDIMSIFRNVSVPGTLNASSFAARVDFATGSVPRRISCQDLDGDGKTDVAVGNNNNSSTSIWRNTGTRGVIDTNTLSPRFQLSPGGAGLGIADIDLDGKPDLLTCQGLGTNVVVFRNISTPGSLTAASFAPSVSFLVDAWPEYVTVGDLDGDNRPDIVTSSWPANSISVLRNTSAPGTINAGSFAPTLNLAANGEPRGLVITDFNGDGFPDIGLANQTGSLSIFQNANTPGTITAASFLPKVNFAGIGNSRNVAAGDIDGDGKPDVVVGNWSGAPVILLRNTMSPTLQSAAPTSGFIGTTVTLSGTNFSPTAANNIVSFNGTPATTISSTLNTITVKVPGGATTGPISVSVCGQVATGSVDFAVTTFSLNRCAAISLNGSTDYVSIADNSSLHTNSLTVEALVNFSVAAGPLAVFVAKPFGGGSADSYAIWYQSGSLNAVMTSGPAISFPWTPTVDQWYHVTMTYDNVSQKEVLYLNGVAVANTTVATAPTFDAHPLLIGADNNSGAYGLFFNGKVDEVRTWNYARSEAEIQSTITGSLTGNESGLLTYYTFSETGQGNGLTIANKATLTGAALNGTTIGTASTPSFVEPCSACLPVTERNALIALYNSTAGASWTNNSNWLSADAGTWFGITTDGCHIASINLPSNNLVGTLPPEIGDLADLVELKVSFNQITGSLPPALTNLTNLELLYLDNNGLSGDLPVNIGDMVSLREINTQNNGFTGSIPPSLVNCMALESIQLEGNQHTAAVPDYFDAFPNLYSINLAFNLLDGTIPGSLGDVASLSFLSLAGNSLTGVIPASLGSLPNLTLLDLSRNQLTGTIPTELGNVSSLNYLHFWSNQLDGAIPPELGSLGNLIELNLSQNQLYSSIPIELGNLSSLTYLNLGENHLSSLIPAELGNLSSLQHLLLNSNYLSGSIPSELGSLANLIELRLDYNILDGDVPSSFTGLDELTLLNLASNSLSSIPAGMGSMSLVVVDLSTNAFTTVPVFTSPTLTKLALEFNNLDYGSLEPNVGVSGITYSPQYDLPPGGDFSFVPGGTLTIPFATPGTANSYQWYRGAQLIPGATSSTLVKPGMSIGDIGFYSVHVTSTIVTGLVLRSLPYVVTTDPCGPGGPDGSLDAAFDPMNTFTSDAQAVREQSDGKIVVSSNGMIINSVYHGGIIRFNTDGTIDNSFNEHSAPPQTAHTMVVQPDDKILFTDVSYYTSLLRLNGDGTDDVAFNANAPSFFDGAIYSVGLQPDGKILVSHADYMGPQVVTRYNADGTQDYSFAELTDINVSVITVQPNGKILMGGDFAGGIMRVNEDGSPDPSFELGGADGYVSDIIVEPGGKIVVVGSFVSFNGAPAYRIARINPDGTNDPGFMAIGVTDVLAGGPVPTRLGLQTDGKIIVAGPFQTFNGATRPSILRLNTDGTVDCSFDGGLGADNTILDVAVTADGIFIAGDFTSYDDETRLSFAKLHNSVLGSCVPAAEHDALVALYNSTTGTSWTDKTNWLNADESTWFGVTVAGCHVTDINLIANNLVGVIPPEIGDLPMLQELRLNTNQLSGSIPTQLGNLSNLYILNLQENQLSGTIPVSFGNLSSLGFLEAQSNQLTGSIPPEVGNATSIVFLRLSNNQLTGPIPTSFQNLTGLYLLEISQNQLSGPILPELGTLTSMKFLNINDNQLSGPIPTTLGNLLLLEDLNLYNNQLTGSLPVELAQCVNLKRFGAGNNQFSGTLPKEYGSWTNLTDFGIYRNMITGTVPLEYLSWTNAIRLYFDHNQIDAIPSFTASTITELNVNDNLLEFGDLEPNISVTGFAYIPQADLPGGNITVNAGSPLTISFSTTGTANQYQWFKNTTLIPGATSSTFSIASAALTDAGNYSVEITNTIVTGLTLRSLDFVVSITPVISIIQQPADVSVCEGAMAMFTTNANGTTNINYQWQYSPDGVVPFVDLSNGGGYANVGTSVLSINTTGPFGAGRYRCRINGDLAVEVITNDEGLFINAVPPAPTTTDAASCSSAALTLLASGGSSGEYRWYTVSAGGTAIAGEVNDTYITPVLSATTTFFVSLNNGTCESGRTPVTAAINTVAKPTVLTSNCTATGATLTGPAGFSSYAWSDGSTNASDIITVAGSYTLTVTSSLGCVSPPSDPVVFTSSFCNQPPVLQPTTITTTVQAIVTLDLSALASDLDNNLDPNSFAVISQPISGASASINSNAELKVDYTDVSFAGTDQLTVQVCDVLAACVQQTITIEVAGDLTVFNALSPNNDGKNEVLYIQYIDVLPDTKENKVTIFDRWGNPVFDVTNYDNTNRVFRGLSNSGSELPPGTYYYVIDFASGTPRKTGFISLRR